MPALDLLFAGLFVFCTVLAYAAALNTDALVRRGFEPATSPRLDFALSLLSLGTWAAFVTLRNAQIRRAWACSLPPRTRPPANR